MRHLLIALFIGITGAHAQKDVNITIDLNGSGEPTDVQIDVFKFYISNIILTFDDETIFAEPDSYHLINQEDSSSQQLTIANVPSKTLSSIDFIVGTDSIANVSGAMSGDLDPILGMYWAWNSGYINFKMEGHVGDKSFTFHIGGYSGDQATATQLSYPVSSDSFVIRANPEAFVNQVDLDANKMIMIPGEKAVALTSFYKNTFSIE